MATGLRYQCGIIGVALVPVLLAQRQWRALLGVGIAALSTFALVQAPDIFIWGEPFVQLRGYIDYNSTHAGNYPKGHWYQYLLTLLGLMIPPCQLHAHLGGFSQRPIRFGHLVAGRHSHRRVSPLSQRLHQQAGTVHPSRRACTDCCRLHRLANVDRAQRLVGAPPQV